MEHIYSTAERLQQVIHDRRLKQADILAAAQPYCKRYGVKLNKSDLSQFVNGKSNPGQWKLTVLALALNVSESWLMGLDVPMERHPLPDLPSPAIAKNVVTFRVNTDIAAGYDQPAQPLDDWEGAEVELPVSMLHGHPADDYFVIRICGDSMYPQYQNGDYVLVLRTNVLDYSGQVAVMLHGEEGTIKKVEYKEGEDWYKLIPINPQYAPKFIEGPEVDTCRIIGIPKLIVRKVNE